MKCKIEERVVVKTKPETKCNRVPKEFCKKQNCTQQQSSRTPKDTDDDSLCYFREQTVSVLLIEMYQFLSNVFA